MRFLVLTIGAMLGVVSPAMAEPVNLLNAKYDPVVSTKEGRIESCGIHFAATMTSLTGNAMGVQGSMNHTFFKNSAPALAIKLMAVEALGGRIIPQKVHHVSLCVNQLDTAKMKSVSGADGNSLMLLMHASEDADFVFNFPTNFTNGAWVSFSLDSSRSDFTFKLPKFLGADLNAFEEFLQCSKKGFENSRRNSTWLLMSQR